MRTRLALLTVLAMTPAVVAGPLVVIPDEAGGEPQQAVEASGPTGFDSAYSDLDLSGCLVLQSDDFGTSWACPGYRGYPLWVAEGDLRFFVSFGFGAPDERAAEQTLGPFNTLGEKIEWRLSKASGAWQPIAAIVRYRFDRTEDQPQGGAVLAVIQLGESRTCHLAYVDAVANADANALARQMADERAGKVDCPAEPELVGKTTPSP